MNGKHWHFLNVQPIEGDETDIRHVSFRDEVSQWANLNKVTTALDSGNAANDTLHVSNVYNGSHTTNFKFEQAKLEELQKWKTMNTYEEVPFSNQKLISTSWVCTERIKGGSLVCKARLVARGFEEDSTNLKKDSPTCSKDSLRLMLIIIVTFNWTVRSMDIKSAFYGGEGGVIFEGHINHTS